jgi:hypothetical protein
MHFLVAAVLAGALFLLIVFVFVPLGQTVSQQMNVAPKPLRAYSWNLLGSFSRECSLFLLVSRPMLQPALWMARASRLRPARDHATRPASGCEPRRSAGSTSACWRWPRNPDPVDPYQQVQYTREQMPNGEVWGGSMQVNHTF